MILPERREASAILAEALDRAEAGEGAVALVDGPIAVGKSTLLAAFAERAGAKGVTTLTAIAAEPESAIPLGVVGQLLASAALSGTEGDWAERMLATGTAHMSVHDTRPARLSAIDAQIVDSLCTVVLSLARQRPLVIVVDDVQHADGPSLAFLEYLARRIRNASVLAVFGHSEQPARQAEGFVLDIVRHPHSRAIRLGTLGLDGVRMMLAHRLGERAAARLAPRCLTLTGGNPLLLSGLIEDIRAAADPSGTEEAADPVPADGYGRAFVECLHRSPEPLARIVQALAVAGSPDVVRRLLDLEPAVVDRCLRTAESAGLLGDRGFRHPLARIAVLGDLDVANLAGLHRRTAELVYADGGDAAVVADHLVAGGCTGLSWASCVLASAAEAMVTAGRATRAIDYLRQACEGATDEAEAARLKIALLRAERRVTPNVSGQRVTDLMTALHAGWLDVAGTAFLAKTLMWHGRFDEARQALEQLAADGPARDPEAAAEVRTLRLWTRLSCPEIASASAPRAGKPAEEDRRVLPTTTETGRRHSAVQALDAVLTQGPSEHAVQKAERVLAGSRLESVGMDALEAALLALIHAERVSTAAQYCDDLIAIAAERREPSRLAMLLGIRSEICIRLGDLPGAHRNASAAFDAVPVRSWGIAVGMPLASLLNAYTAMGRHGEAAELLNVPIPEATFKSRYGLAYLQARGRCHLASGDFEGALADFLSCGDLMIRWRLDTPTLVGWRTEAAEAWLRLDERAKARSALEDQLAQCDSGTAPRVRGSALRLLAATIEPRRRPATLRQAVDLLHESGDRYELARALADLANLYHGLGETRRGRVIGRQAWTIADQCCALPLRKLMAADSGRFEPEPQSPTALLTDAEQRVADLVALGHTNREIARLLCVTVSTVEQHLTRIYRKIGVSGRANLATMLSGGPSPVLQAPREHAKATVAAGVDCLSD
jgi:DNA-binding CsgD family transcriptional regulator